MKQLITGSSKAIFLCLFSIIVFLTSCNKEKEDSQNQALDKSTDLKPVVITDQKNAKKVKYKSIKEIVNSGHKTKLEKFILKMKNKHGLRAIDDLGGIPTDPSSEAEAAQILQPMNAEILTYLTQTYPHLGSASVVNVNDPDFAYFAQVYSIAEQSGFITASNSNLVTARAIPTWLRCTVDLVMGYFDVRGLISGLGTFEFGTVWAVVKTAIKKYVGWFAAAILVYDIATECI
jgi:hypothetical protein